MRTLALRPPQSLGPLATLAVLGLAVLFAASTVACDSTVTESDLQKWTHNDVGLKRIEQVVVDPQQPFATRIRALEVVVEKGFPRKPRLMIEQIGDEADRKKVAVELTKQLVKHIELKSDYQLDAKDAVMTLARFMTKAEFEPIQMAVAKWAFSDIDWNTKPSDVKQRLESRISSGQVRDLHAHGWQTGAILISHGFAVDKMVDYLADAKDPAATELLLRGLRKLHANVGAQAYHIQALRKTESPAAAAYLLEMYFNDKLDEEFRTGAFNVAIDMMDAKAIKAAPGPVIARLEQLLANNNPEDRWLGAANLIRLGGAKRIDQVMAAFKDDKIYGRAQEEPAKSTMDLCLDIHDLGFKNEATPVFRRLLGSGNRIQKAMALVCLKANGVHAARSDISAHAAMVDRLDDVDLHDFLGEQLKLGTLAANVLEGLDMLKQLDADVAAKKYTAEQAKTRRLLIIFELAQRGDAYKQVVEARYQGWLAEQKAEKEKKANEGAGAKPAGAKPAGDTGAKPGTGAAGATGATGSTAP